MWKQASVVTLVLIALAGCGESGDHKSESTGGGGGTPEWTAKYPGDLGGAKGLLTELMGASGEAAVSKSQGLKPRDSDYEALVRNQEDADTLRAHFAPLWAEGKAVIGPKSGQTSVLVWAASGEELAAGTGDANEFPGGYKKIAARLAAGVTFYRFKFVEPGQTSGMAFDGLAHVNGRWCIIPKPWRAFP